VTPPPLTLAALVGHHVATLTCPWPEPTTPITWVVAVNGTFKHGCSADLDVVIQVWSGDCGIPGLARLLPQVRWSAWPQRLPGDLLAPLLESARQAMAPTGASSVLRPVEKQFFLVWRDGTVRLIAPRAQEGTASHLRYTMPERGVVLCDIHSHHAMRPYFSATDDRDDAGLSVSVVIGDIYQRPTLLCRLNVYGHRQIVPAALVFDHLGPFRDAGSASEERHAVSDD
jgi:PRTRC genetic system protein A